MRDDWLDVGAEPVHVRRWGRESGRPLLFLHSLGPAASGALLGPGSDRWRPPGGRSRRRTTQGSGNRPRSAPTTTPTRASPIARWAIADALGWRELVLSGHSWGGSVAVHAAAAQPDRVQALVLVDSGHLDYADQPGADLTAIARVAVRGG